LTETVIDDGLVRSLLRDQHPDLADHDLELADGGWDNQLWRLGDLHPANVVVSDEATIRRARGWAALTGISLISIGQAWEQGLPGGKPTWGTAGRRTLDRVLAYAT
jgi:hypothetical protein